MSRRSITPHGRDAVGRCRAPAPPMCAEQRALRAPRLYRPRRARRPGGRGVLDARGPSLLRARGYHGEDHPLLQRPGLSASSEIFAHIPSGFPLGLALDRAGNLISCVGAMGLYSTSPKDREVTSEALRRDHAAPGSSIVDDARLRDPNDCDIAPDGRIFFTDSTTRYDAHEWALDSIESRPTGRLLCYDPKTGKTTTLLEVAEATAMPTASAWRHDGQSLSSWRNPGPAACTVTGSPDPRQARSNASSRTCRDIPTTSTAPPTAPIGWPGSACAPRASISPCAIPACASA